MFSKRRRTRIPRRAQALRSNKYKFSVKTHPLEGIISFGLGIAALLVLLASCYLATTTRGNIGEIAALMNMFAFIVAIAGVVFAFIAFRKKDIHTLFPTLGVVFSGLLAIVYLVIYITGTLL